jgi:hypothetical protein
MKITKYDKKLINTKIRKIKVVKIKIRKIRKIVIKILIMITLLTIK